MPDQALQPSDDGDPVDQGPDGLVREFSRDVRRRTASQRHQSARARVDTADEQDAAAHGRDLAALERDQAADTRDLEMARRDVDLEHELRARGVTGDELADRIEHLQRAADERARAAEQRTHAATDRRAAHRDREQAAARLLQALADGWMAAHQLAIAETDALTGARTRSAGLNDLDVELDRCARTSGLLVVAYIGVIGLKDVNDNHGHAAGDALLVRAVSLMKRHLRPYDLIIRLGGDEFLCTMSDMSVADVHERFRRLADAPDGILLRTGFAQFTPGDTATDLIARADSQLAQSRRH